MLGGKNIDNVAGLVVKTDGSGRELWSRKYGSIIYGVVEVGGGGQFLVFGRSEISCLSVSGKVLWSEPYSKYVEGLGSLASVLSGRSSVSAFVSEVDGSIVVVIPNDVPDEDAPSLWVASFTVNTSSFNSGGGGDGVLYRSMLLYGVLVVVVVVVFVGFLVYLKKRKQHRIFFKFYNAVVFL